MCSSRCCLCMREAGPSVRCSWLLREVRGGRAKGRGQNKDPGKTLGPQHRAALDGRAALTEAPVSILGNNYVILMMMVRTVTTTTTC